VPQSRPALTERTGPSSSLSDQLSQWLGWSDAIALSAALNANPHAVSSGAIGETANREIRQSGYPPHIQYINWYGQRFSLAELTDRRLFFCSFIK
jgi:hypothetical protein